MAERQATVAEFMGLAPYPEREQAPTRSEIVRALQQAHSGHGVFHGGNFFDCRRCRLHVMFRDVLTWVPPRARKEHQILTLDDVQKTVRT